jgi:hypothetical protein
LINGQNSEKNNGGHCDGERVNMNDVLVIDIPASVPAAEASRILSEPIARGYYLKGITESEPMRAVFAQYAAKDDKCPEELEAMDLVMAHPKDTASRLVQRLCQQGIYRGTAWVNKTREELA